MAKSILAALAVSIWGVVQVHSAVLEVTVGNAGFSYSPNTTRAKVGDIINFQFFPPNHSVIRAQYTDDPSCPGGYCNPVCVLRH